MTTCNRRSSSKLFTSLAFLFLLTVIVSPTIASAQTVLDLGPDSSGASFSHAFFAGREGTPLDGRQITSEFIFANNQYIRMESGATEGNSFIIDLTFVGTHDTGVPGNPVFSGWIEDRAGNRTNGVISNTGAGANLFGYLLSFSSEELLTEIYRIQFTVTLPTVGGEELTDTQFISFTPNQGGQVSVATASVATEASSVGDVKVRYDR